MPPNTATSLINGFGETTYQVMVGNRMTGETRQAPVPKRPALIPYIGEAFGASQEVEAAATAEARHDAILNGQAWSYPMPVQTTAQAAVAARWLLQQAEIEAAGRQGAGYFDRLAASAAYTYYRNGETRATILNRVINLVKGSAPRVADKARKLLSWVPPQVVATKPVAATAKKKHHHSATSPDYEPPESVPIALPPTAWEQITAGLPPWAPTAAGVVAAGLLTFALWPKRRAVQA